MCVCESVWVWKTTKWKIISYPPPRFLCVWDIYEEEERRRREIRQHRRGIDEEREGGREEDDDMGCGNCFMLKGQKSPRVRLEMKMQLKKSAPRRSFRFSICLSVSHCEMNGNQAVESWTYHFKPNLFFDSCKVDHLSHNHDDGEQGVLTLIQGAIHLVIKRMGL